MLVTKDNCVLLAFTFHKKGALFYESHSPSCWDIEQ